MGIPGRNLRRGNRGEAVQAVQRRLGVRPTGLFGPTTEARVLAFQRSRGLAPDGIVGPRTWAALFSQPPTLRTAALAEARRRIGVRERPPGSNSGPEVDAYLRRVGLGPGHFWCLAFVYYCVDEAARKRRTRNPLPKTASCSRLYRWAKANGRLVTQPEPGDIFLCIGGETGHYHAGFVEGPVRGEHFPTVEGNSNAEGSANGIGVFRRSRGRLVASCHYVRI